MNLITVIETDAEALWEKVTGAVTAEAKAAENAVLILYKDLMASAVAHGPQYVSDLESEAATAVSTVALLPITGTEKAIAAAGLIVAAFKAKDLPIITNDIEGAVRAAYASFVAAQATVIATPAPTVAPV